MSHCLVESLVYGTQDEAGKREYAMDAIGWHPISVFSTRLLLSGELSALNSR